MSGTPSARGARRHGLTAAWKRAARPVRALIAVLSALLCLRVLLWLLPYPGLSAFEKRQNSTRIYDANGELLHVVPLEDGLRREHYPLAEIPRDVADAFISAEDAHFWWHPGVDFVSVVRAAFQNRRAGHVVSGASTITMQLVRLISPRTGPVTAATKAKEMLLALWLDAKLSKKRILELYLNNVPFGYQTEGMGSAARTFFGLTPQELSHGQAETLARIPRRPAEYAPARGYRYGTRCPHLVRRVVSQYQDTHAAMPDALTLSVDARLTERTEKLIQQKLTEFEEARVHNGAALAVDNRTGAIVLWVGNASFEDDAHGGQIDGVLVPNQPGSSMKPFLYALALEKGFPPAQALPDIPQDFGGAGVYIPLNFNNRFNGPVLFRISLASSLNVPAVYLLHELGMDSYLSCLLDLGFDSLRGTQDTTGLSLALGAREVTLAEMVRAFSVFANDGLLIDALTVQAPGKKARAAGGTRVYSADTARIICSILSDKQARELGFGHAAVFDTPYPSIFKTGTSNQFQNIIAMGATSRYTVGVWMGNFAGETVVKQTGSSIPAAVVRAILDELTERDGAEPFKEPELYRKMPVCALSGMAAGESCPAVTMEYVAARTAEHFAAVPCDWHVIQGGRLTVRYPSEYQHWANGSNMAGTIFEGQGSLAIQYPRNGATFVYDPSLPPDVQQLRVQASGGRAAEAMLYLDGEPVAAAQGLLLWHVPLTRGTHLLTVECAGETQAARYTVE